MLNFDSLRLLRFAAVVLAVALIAMGLVGAAIFLVGRALGVL